MDRLEAMSVVIAVAEAGSLSAAARALGAPLATVSRKVSELEAHLKTRLFTRSSRAVTLTDAGRSYLAAAKRVLEQVDEAERAAAGEYSAARGDLTVTAPVVFGRLHVLPVAVEFLKAYPEIDLRLVLADRAFSFADNQVDVAVRIGELPDSNLVALRVATIRRVLVASPDYLARRAAPETPDDLASHDCITFEGLGAARGWRFGTGREERSVAIRSRLVVNVAEAAVDAAVSGLGVTRVLSYQAAAALEAGRLKVLLDAFEPSPWPVHLVHLGQGLTPLKLRAFLDFAGPRLKARLAKPG